MTWHEAYKAIAPFVVKIETSEGFGTGFVFATNENRSFAAVATALHVIESARAWRLPIKIRQHGSSAELFLAENDRVIFIDRLRDSAAIGLGPDQLKNLNIPPSFLPMIPKDRRMIVGGELGWVGYPALAPAELCFFKGSVSTFVESDDSYFIDGVAISGVSGGPVFHDRGIGPPHLVGLISAYLANVQQRGMLPGLMKAHDLTHLHKAIEAIKSVEEARSKAAAAAKNEPAPEKATPAVPPSSLPLRGPSEG